jgi:PAS domain S-box-containing protein
MKKEHEPKTVLGRRIRDRMNVFAPVLAILFSFVLIFYSLHIHDLFRNTLVRSFQDHQLTIVEGTANGIESLLNRLMSEMQTMATSRSVRDPDSEECKERLREFYKAYQDIVYASYRMNHKGILVYMYPVDPKGLNADISKQAHVIKLFETRRLVVSGLFRAVEGFDAIAIHAPVFKDRELNGSLATVVKLEKITEQFLEKTRAGENGYSWLVDKDGVILYHPKTAYIGLKITDTDLFDKRTREDLEEQVKLESDTKLHMGNNLFALAPFEIGDRTWTVILSTPYSDISSPIVAHFKSTWIINVSFLLVILTAGAMYMRAGMRAAVLEVEKGFLEQKVGLQEELRNSRDRLDTIVKTIPSGLFTIDTNHIIRSWNNTARRITGFSAEEIIGQHCSRIFIWPCAGACGLYDPGSPAKPILGVECKVRTKDGRELTLKKNSDYLRDADGTITGGIESFIDITDSKRAEEDRIRAIAFEKEVEQLRRMDEVKTNFLSMVSHELRTPLSVMLGNLSMAEKGKYGALPEKFLEKLRVIMKRGWQLNDLIDGLLDLSKIESGHIELNKQELDLPELAEKVAGEFQETVENNNLTIGFDFKPGATGIVADRILFSQLLRNLISNAVKFTHAGGHILISSYIRKDSLVVSVRDTGIGIPEHELQKVFDRFYQVDNSSTRQYGGTGLGLAIVKDIAELHKAEIEIESDEGKGTEIRVALPTGGRIFLGHGRSEAEKTASARRTLPDEIASIPFRVLIVDRDPDTLTTITEIVEGSSGKVLFADTIREAVSALEEKPVDILVLDPAQFETGASGDLMSKIAAEQECRPGKVLAVLVSENVEAARKFAAGRAGISICLNKPLQAEQFIKILKTLLV